MGNLTKAAGKAFKKGSRRAHVPDWFEPLSYVFAGFAGVVLVISALTTDNPPPTADTSPAPVVVDGDGAATIDPGTSDPDDGPTGTAAANDGLDPAAAQTARTATIALFTGDFSEVTIYPGQPQPVVITTWSNPVVVELRRFETFPDGTTAVTHLVDPDGDGSEAPREVTVLVIRNDQGWVFLPG